MMDFYFVFFSTVVFIDNFPPSLGKKPKNDGFFARIITRIMDNVEVTIKNVHIRYEDSANGFSIGVTLGSLFIYTINQQGKR